MELFSSCIFLDIISNILIVLVPDVRSFSAHICKTRFGNSYAFIVIPHVYLATQIFPVYKVKRRVKRMKMIIICSPSNLIQWEKFSISTINIIELTSQNASQ